MIMMRMILSKIFISLPVVVLVLLLVPTIHANDDESASTSSSDATTTDTCGLYLAISSTSTVEDTNWGLFLGQDMTGLHRPIGNPEIGIVVSNLRIHNDGVLHLHNNDSNNNDSSNEKRLNAEFRMKLVDYFEAFFWVPSTAGAKYFFDTTTTASTAQSKQRGERAIAAISGPGVLASYSKHMTNSDWDHRAAYVRTSPNEVSKLSHPNRGAFSPYHNCQIWTTVNNIKAGTEVFMEYGDSWAEKQNDEEELTKEDYVKMDETVTQMIAFFSKYNDTVLDDDSRLEIYSFLMKDIMKAAVGPTKARRMAAILPPNPNDLHLVPAAGGVMAYSDPTAHRSLSFLQKYGLCMDHVYAAPSTIPNIGRGAFAKRSLSKGSMVVPIPLTHVADKAIFNMYPLTIEPESGKLVRESDTVISQQLIVNYCFGHPESTMLFYPSGSMTSLINHSKEPNAKLQWSTHPNHQKLWYDLDPFTTLMEEEYMYMGLILEVVALRDIEPDEEIFIDYGMEWQQAYDKHVETWNQKIQSGIIPQEWPIRAMDLNTQYHHTLKPFPTVDEQANDGTLAFPSNVMVMAFLLLSDTENAGTIEDPKLWNIADPNTAYTSDNLFEVSIIGRTENTATDDSSTTTTYSYMVRWESPGSVDEDDDDENKKEDDTEKKVVIVAQVPHDAIVVIDRPGTTDQQYLYEHSFRHFIGIPDEIFPIGPWRNVAARR
jgi:hypothetical protein